MRAAILALVAVALAAGDARGDIWWYPVESPTQTDLTGLAFAPDGTGWAVGHGPTVLRYDGETWQAMPPPPGAGNLEFVAAIAAGEMWAGDSRNKLYHLRDGAWRSWTMPGAARLTAADFSAPDNGYAVGLFGALFRYDGTSWSAQRLPISRDASAHLSAVIAVARDDVWASGPSGVILRYDGTRWHRALHEVVKGWAELQRFDGDVLLRGRTPRLYRRVHGGPERSWQPFAESLPSWSGAKLARWGDTIWSLGVSRAGEATRIIGFPAAGGPAGDRRPYVAARAHGGLTDIAATSRAAWAVGGNGIILRTRQGKLPSFFDGTFEAGVGLRGDGRLGLLADIDGDGARDLLLTQAGGYVRLLRAASSGRFRDSPISSPILEDYAAARVARFADIDGDGALDHLTCRQDEHGAKRLSFARHLDDGRFVPVPRSMLEESDEESAALPALCMGVEVADLDGDGDLDVYQTQGQIQGQIQGRFQGQAPDDSRLVGAPLPNVLWRNNGLGGLERVALADVDGGAATARASRVLLSDLDSDGLTDIVAVDVWGSGNRLYRQGPAGRFRDVTSRSGLTGGYLHGGGALAEDFDGDGDLDLLIYASCSAPGFSRLYENRGDLVFRDITSRVGLAFCASSRVAAGDIDNDGDIDVIAPNSVLADRFASERHRQRARVFVNNSQGRFTEVASMLGLAHPARSLLVDDFDLDGDLDVYMLDRSRANQLWVNDNREANWLRVTPRGAPPNRYALGARIAVRTPDGTLVGVRETSWRAPVAHFGLGRHEVVDVEVRFPGQAGVVVHRRGVPRGSRIEVSAASARVGSKISAAFIELGFFVRHRLYWADVIREALKVLAAMLVLLAAVHAGRRIGAKRIVHRWRFVVPVSVVGAALALFAMRVAPVSALADYGPVVAFVVFCALALALDRYLTRLAEARFIGPYELIEYIDRGGMGTVYRARQPNRRGQEIVALKVLRPELITDREIRKRFMREAELAARVEHPAVVQVFACGECQITEGRQSRRTMYIAMEYVQGPSLRKRMGDDPPLSLRQSVEIVRDAADALAAVHESGVLHRDIKPDNVLLTLEGKAKLTDFGIAGAQGVTTLTSVGSVMGTLAYMSPEQAQGAQIDERSDIYSLGIVLYECVTGRQPFQHDQPVGLLSQILSETAPPSCAFRPDIPEALDDLIARSIARDKDDRPATAAAFSRELGEILLDLPEEAEPGGPGAPLRPGTEADDQAQPGLLDTLMWKDSPS